MKDLFLFIKKTISAFPKWLKISIGILFSVSVGFLSFGSLMSCEVDYQNEGTKLHVSPNSLENELINLPSYSAVISCKTYSELDDLLQTYGFNCPEDFEDYLRSNKYISVADDFHNFVKFIS